MMRSLWTAASGMMSQQTSVDTIANNLANVNTVGYKQEQTQFKSLLYQNLQAKTTSANGENKPVGAQVGLGSRGSAVTSIYTQGRLLARQQHEKSRPAALRFERLHYPDCQRQQIDLRRHAGEQH